MPPITAEQCRRTYHLPTVTKEGAMAEGVDPLVIEFLTWVAGRARTYEEAMEAWRTNCPRHTVWEDALDGGYIQVERGGSLALAGVMLTARGEALIHGLESASVASEVV